MYPDTNLNPNPDIELLASKGSVPSTATAAPSQHEIIITVLYFAAAHSATGLDHERVHLPITNSGSTSTNFVKNPRFNLSALPALLASLHPSPPVHSTGSPGLKLVDVLETCQWSVDAEMVDDPETIWLTGGEEVAVICPVSGG